MKIKWLGHAAFEIETEGKKIYLDPYLLPSKHEEADLILVTHEHYDHCDVENITKLRGENTTIVASQGAAEKIPGEVKTVKEGDKLKFENIKITATPAYNINKSFHPPQLGVGFIIDTGKHKIYHAGDTDLIPEMEELTSRGITLALLPVGGKYTMNAEEAAEAAGKIKPKIALPMHYGEIIGTKKDAQKFKQKVQKSNLKTKVKILEKEENWKI